MNELNIIGNHISPQYGTFLKLKNNIDEIVE
jgi:hypothetical protein